MLLKSERHNHSEFEGLGILHTRERSRLEHCNSAFIARAHSLPRTFHAIISILLRPLPIEILESEDEVPSNSLKTLLHSSGMETLHSIEMIIANMRIALSEVCRLVISIKGKFTFLTAKRFLLKILLLDRWLRF
jgi:hypothetical protein